MRGGKSARSDQGRTALLQAAADGLLGIWSATVLLPLHIPLVVIISSALLDYLRTDISRNKF